MLPFFSTFLNSRGCFFPYLLKKDNTFFFLPFTYVKKYETVFFLVKRSTRLDYILGGVYCIDLITYWVDCTIWPPPFNTTCPTASYSLSCIPLQVSFDWDSVHRGSSKSRKGIRASHAWLVLCKFHNNLNNQSEITCNLIPDLSAYKINAMHFSLLLGCPFLCQRGVNFHLFQFSYLYSCGVWGHAYLVFWPHQDSGDAWKGWLGSKLFENWNMLTKIEGTPYMSEIRKNNQVRHAWSRSESKL